MDHLLIRKLYPHNVTRNRICRNAKSISKPVTFDTELVQHTHDYTVIDELNTAIRPVYAENKMDRIDLPESDDDDVEQPSNEVENNIHHTISSHLSNMPESDGIFELTNELQDLSFKEETSSGLLNDVVDTSIDRPDCMYHSTPDSILPCSFVLADEDVKQISPKEKSPSSLLLNRLSDKSPSQQYDDSLDMDMNESSLHLGEELEDHALNQWRVAKKDDDTAQNLAKKPPLPPGAWKKYQAARSGKISRTRTRTRRRTRANQVETNDSRVHSIHIKEIQTNEDCNQEEGHIETTYGMQDAQDNDDTMITCPYNVSEASNESIDLDCSLYSSGPELSDTSFVKYDIGSLDKTSSVKDATRKSKSKSSLDIVISFFSKLSKKIHSRHIKETH